MVSGKLNAQEVSYQMGYMYVVAVQTGDLFLLSIHAGIFPRPTQVVGKCNAESAIGEHLP